LGSESGEGGDGMMDLEIERNSATFCITSCAWTTCPSMLYKDIWNQRSWY
jgi:hypothetical protein